MKYPMESLQQNKQFGKDVISLCKALHSSMDALWHEFGSYDEDHAKLIDWRPPEERAQDAL